MKELSQTRNSRNRRDSLGSPPVSHFPSASDVAPSPANASVNPPSWFLFQILIVFSVIASNVYWHWTPNPYVPAGAGLLLAWVLTWLVTRLRNRIGR
jgi:hypothetical protein